MKRKKRRRTNRKYRRISGREFEGLVANLFRIHRPLFYVVIQNEHYVDYKGREGEIDILAYHYIDGKVYIIIVECKTGDREYKAKHQLHRAKEYIKRKYAGSNIRIFTFYAHHYFNGHFQLEWEKRV